MSKIDYESLKATALSLNDLMPENAYDELVEFYTEFAELDLKDPLVQKVLLAVCTELALFAKGAKASHPLVHSVVSKIALSLSIVAARAAAESNITEGAEALLGSEG